MEQVGIFVYANDRLVRAESIRPPKPRWAWFLDEEREALRNLMMRNR